ncbi:MAG: class I SAM-dependent methyltransferase [Actinomycetales bacterium]
MAQHPEHQHSGHQNQGHQQSRHQHAGPGGAPDDDAGLAEMLDLDAEVLSEYLDMATAWVAQLVPGTSRRIVDLGAGTGTGTLALARQFGSAELVAVDNSASMLERIQAAASRHGVADRLRTVLADLDLAWPDIEAADLVWASSSLHHFADPDRVLRDVHAALNPGGLFMVLEMDDFPRFLPEDVGIGAPGLESRCHEAIARQGWNSHPDWGPHLEQAGFVIAARRGISVEANPAADMTRRYAHASLRRIRSALEDMLAAEDLATLDRLLADDGPDALLSRGDLTVRNSRTAWAARRP